MNAIYPEYEKDVYGWAIHTATLLRNKRMSEVDFDNIIEEMESLGRSEKHELINRLAILIAHLLKWQYQPTMQGHSWKYSIIEQREQAKIHLSDNPSLKSKMDDILSNSYKVGRSKAIRETGLDEKVFPQKCPYSFEEIINDDFYP